VSDPYPPSTPSSREPGGPVEPKRKLGPREIGGIVALILLVIFIVENTRKVKIRFIIPEVKAPLFIALLIAALVGALALWLIQHRMESRRKRRKDG
jgi:uncharacterized integral membrane protein